MNKAVIELPRKPDAPLTSEMPASTLPPADGEATLGKAFGGRNQVPAWERNLGKERREELLRLAGGLTGEKLKS